MSKPSPAPAVRHDKTNHRPGAAVSVVIAVTHAESAPTIDVTLESANGQAELSVLPDSGADISAAGPELLEALGTNVQNLLPTDVSPKVADGRPMKALEAIPVRIRLHERTVPLRFISLNRSRVYSFHGRHHAIWASFPPPIPYRLFMRKRATNR